MERCIYCVGVKVRENDLANPTRILERCQLSLPKSFGDSIPDCLQGAGGSVAMAAPRGLSHPLSGAMRVPAAHRIARFGGTRPKQLGRYSVPPQPLPRAQCTLPSSKVGEGVSKNPARRTPSGIDPNSEESRAEPLHRTGGKVQPEQSRALPAERGTYRKGRHPAPTLL
jgi:hypothetical protein